MSFNSRGWGSRAGSFHSGYTAQPMAPMGSGFASRSASFRDPGVGDCNACGVGHGDDCHACGMDLGGDGGNLAFVGAGNGSYTQETTYRYVGYGGDFGVVKRRRDFTCALAFCCLPLLLLLPLFLWWLFAPEGYDCDAGFNSWQTGWTVDKQMYCCEAVNRGCKTAVLPTLMMTIPPTPFQTAIPTPPPTPMAAFVVPSPPSAGPVDPFNCAIGAEATWPEVKKNWCCRVHHKACPGPPSLPPPPPDPFNCADGWASWQASWTVQKKDWCCRVHGKGCTSSDGCQGTTSPLFDCEAGFGNWLRGWSVPKKAWCCAHEGKGCERQAAGGCV